MGMELIKKIADLLSYIVTCSGDGSWRQNNAGSIVLCA